MLPNIAVGFLVYRPERRVMLHLRGPENDPDPNLWAAIGGHEEPEDGGDLRQTLCRELQEELAFRVEAGSVEEIFRQVDGQGRVIAVHGIPVQSPDLAFRVQEGRGVSWFSVREALDLPDLAEVTRADLPRIADWLDTGGI